MWPALSLVLLTHSFLLSDALSNYSAPGVDDLLTVFISPGFVRPHCGSADRRHFRLGEMADWLTLPAYQLVLPFIQDAWRQLEYLRTVAGTSW